MARAFTAGSMRLSSSSSRAESPASLTRSMAGAWSRRRRERVEQLAMDAAESTIRHQHDDVAVTMFLDDRPDDLLVLGHMPRALAAAAQVAHELRCIQALR